MLAVVTFVCAGLATALELVPPYLVKIVIDDVIQLSLIHILVFIPSIGSFITPDLLGGARSMMIGNLIQHEYLVVRDLSLIHI